MGCGASASKTMVDPIVQPIERQEEEVKEDKPVFSSDIHIETEYIGDDDLKIMKTLRHYQKPSPISKNHKTLSPVQWFGDWIPEYPEATTDVGKPKHTRTQDRDSGMEDVANIGLTVHDIEFRARHTPRYFNESFDDLIEYLTMGVDASERPEMLMVRALVGWLSSQNLNTYKHETGTEESPEGCLALLAQRRTTYSTVFTIICRKADLQCVQIGGMCKALGRYQPGDVDMKSLACLWNAVYIEKQWHIIHPLWMCRTYVGPKSNDWFKFPDKSQQSNTFIKTAFTEYYVMTDPEEFKYACYPFDPQWQLQTQPMTRKEFLDQPYLLPPFFGLGLVLKSKNACVLEVNNGRVKIEIEARANNSELLHLWYTLSFGNNISHLNEADREFVQPQILPKHVRMVRNNNTWKFDIHLPVEGVYKFAVFTGPNQNPLIRTAEFRLDCKGRKNNCLPLRIDPGFLGFGPGVISEKAGLVIPLKCQGEYCVKKGDIFKAKFLLDGKMAEKIETKATFYASGFAGSRTEKVQCDIDRKLRELSITANIINDGEYMLTIWTAANFEQRKRNGYQPVCHYLLSSNVNPLQESPRQRHQRRKLLEAIDMNNLDELDMAMEKCIKEGIIPKDEELEYARLKYQLLKARKDIHVCNLRRNLDITLQTLRFLKQSRLTRVLSHEIVALVHLKEGLDYGHEGSDWEEDDSEYSLQYSING